MHRVQHGQMGALGRKLVKNVIYKDHNLVAIAKWPGLVTQGDKDGTALLDHNMLKLLKRKSSDDIPRLVHRLDKPTSGVLVFARTQEYARKLSDLFLERKVGKTYWAVLNGLPSMDGGVLVSAVNTRKPSGVGGNHTAYSFSDYDNIADEVTIPKAFSLMKTTFEVLLKNSNSTSFVQLHPETGFTHQLRIQCNKCLGSPIVGDTLHGIYTRGGGLSNWCRLQLRNTPHAKDGKPLIPLMLHARSLTFPGCAPDGTDLVITAPLPPNFLQVCETLGLDLPQKYRK